MRLVDNWEHRHRPGDSPKPREAWEAQYTSQQWAFLGQLNEMSRYAVIIGYLTYLKPDGSVLDIGGGDGVLYERYRPYTSGAYVGLDISEAAVASVRARHPGSRFFQADAEAYVPTERFDVLIFNETLYYFRNPAGTLARYAATALAPTGIVIVSLYIDSFRSQAIAQQLRKQFTVMDETITRQGGKSWVCLVLTFP